jgi:hypothetical protein
MLFMHQACVFETAQQYVKSNEILTEVIKEAYQLGRIDDKLKDAIQAFQLKMMVKQEYLAYYIRKEIPNCFDAMTTSPVESMNCYIKHRSKASTLNNTSRSLMLITEGTDSRIAGIDKTGTMLVVSVLLFYSLNLYSITILSLLLLAKRELQLTVLSSKLPIKNLYHRKCVYLLNQLFDDRNTQCCVMHDDSQWLVWNFTYDPPFFKDDEFNIALLFPVFANVYHVKVTQFGDQRFLKCNCLHYERCGLPCSHILRITNEVEETMIKIQHLKVYQVHHGSQNCNISSKLIQGSSLQTSYEDMGMPISEQCLQKALNPSLSM